MRYCIRVTHLEAVEVVVSVQRADARRLGLARARHDGLPAPRAHQREHPEHCSLKWKDHYLKAFCPRSVDHLTVTPYKQQNTTCGNYWANLDDRMIGYLNTLNGAPARYRQISPPAVGSRVSGVVSSS